MKTKHLIILDVCNTLVNTNSTFSYIYFLLDKWIKSRYKILFHNRILCYFYNLIYKFLHFDIRIFLTKKYFKWLNVNKIKSISKDYFNWYESRIYPHMLKIINKSLKSSKIIMLSASINPPIDFLKEKFWIEGFSSILQEKNWKYTWKVLQPLWWNKEKIFMENNLNLENYNKIDFYTDNHDDINLIKYLYKKNRNLKIWIMSYWNKKYCNL